MIGAGILDRLRRRDPDCRILRRAARLTLVTLPAYFFCRYGFGGAVTATYVVFGVVAVTIFIRLPGRARRRSLTLLLALPAVWALVSVGTVLDAVTWPSVAVTLVVGFSVAFFGVGGPRLVGMAGGLQLFFIVANFPAHHLNPLPARLIGATAGVVLTAAAESLLWPDPTPVPFQQRLAEAVEAVAGLLDASAEVVDRRATADGAVAWHRDRAAAAIERIRIAGFPRQERPTSASRRDRALRDGAAATQEICEQVLRLITRPELGRRRYPDVAAQMRRCAQAMRQAGRTLAEGAAGGADEPGPAAELPEPAAPPRQPPDVDRLWLLATLWATIEHVRILEVATRLATGRPVRFDGDRPPPASGAFWYARHSEISLYWRQLRVHLTPRSVFFQGALRLAVGLAAARGVAGELRLSHGFWTLLGTLMVMRTSAAKTGRTLLSAVAGTLTGAIVTGLLLRFTHGGTTYAVEFSIATVVGFAVGPLLGVLSAQATQTVLITLLFAQLAPADWSLATVRLVDVLLGSAVGIVAGAVMWPAGAGGELRRRVAAYLRAGGELVGETVGTLTDPGRYGDRPAAAMHAGRRELILADASLSLYYQERLDPRMAHVHWEAAMVAGHHILHGAELLLGRYPAGCLATWPQASGALADIAGQLRRGYREIAGELRDGRIDRPVVTPSDGAAIGARVTDVVLAGGGRPEDSPAIAVAGWLATLGENLDWIQAASGAPPRR